MQPATRWVIISKYKETRHLFYNGLLWLAKSSLGSIRVTAKFRKNTFHHKHRFFTNPIISKLCKNKDRQEENSTSSVQFCRHWSVKKAVPGIKPTTAASVGDHATPAPPTLPQKLGVGGRGRNRFCSTSGQGLAAKATDFFSAASLSPLFGFTFFGFFAAVITRRETKKSNNNNNNNDDNKNINDDWNNKQ